MCRTDLRPAICQCAGGKYPEPCAADQTNIREMEDGGYGGLAEQPGKEPGTEVRAAGRDALGIAGEERVAAEKEYRLAVRYGPDEPRAGKLAEEITGNAISRGWLCMV